jgi:hypothetical protein
LRVSSSRGAAPLEQPAELPGVGGDAAHALHAVEHQALRSEQGPYRTADGEGDLPGLHFVAVGFEGVEHDPLVECGKNLPGKRTAGEHPGRLYQEPGPTPELCRDGGQAGVVAIAHVFFHGLPDETPEVEVGYVGWAHTLIAGRPPGG